MRLLISNTDQKVKYWKKIVRAGTPSCTLLSNLREVVCGDVGSGDPLYSGVITRMSFKAIQSHRWVRASPHNKL